MDKFFKLKIITKFIESDIETDVWSQKNYTSYDKHGHICLN